MLVAISITLVMMAVVVGVFATVSESVSKRRAAIEVGNQLRHVRNVLQRDLEGATCPVIPWQRPESDVGYFEIVEGMHADFYPSLLTDRTIGGQQASTQWMPEIDHAISTIPASNLEFAKVLGQDDWVTDGGGLGDYDDVLAFTSRNEKEPFTGPAPLGNIAAGGAQNPFAGWTSQSISSPVAEVVWYCVENPDPASVPQGSFGEAGFRSIYRRTLLVASWLDYRYKVGNEPAKSRPGVLRILDRNNVTEDEALAALIAFQERYDISARISFDPTIRAPEGRWTIVANTLADLTDRKNRFEHHGYVVNGGNSARIFPYMMVSKGVADPGNAVQEFVTDTELSSGTGAEAALQKQGNAVLGASITSTGSRYIGRPLVTLQGGGTARAIVNEGGEVVHVTTGLVPLGITGDRTTRRGADLMLADALAFDIQIFDPEAPVYGMRANGRALRESDNDKGDAQLDFAAIGPNSLGWGLALTSLSEEEATNPIDGNGAPNGAIVRRGAYADLGYLELHRQVLRLMTGSNPSFAYPNTALSGLVHGKSQLADTALTRVYDTWNFAYENDGVDQDGINGPDQGTNGFDDPANYGAGMQTLFGPDDPGERETAPPYPVPLRAVQVKLRAYEPDSRQMREVTVRQHFVPE